ncbi:MAG: VCBS repeat-containing protein, partial [Bryobacteraceae bacterium]
WPAFSDALGWNLPEYYATIQFADVDGDKQEELIARNSSGIVIWRYDQNTEAWVEQPAGPPLSDSAMWVVPECYSTIQCADVDGDGQAEIVGRGFFGMVGYHRDKQTGQWNLFGTGWPTWSDPVWIGQQYYGTIQCADIDGDGQAEILARAPEGLVGVKWQGDTNSWAPISALAALSDANGWGMPGYFETIQFADIGGFHKKELVARNSQGMFGYRYESGTWRQIGFEWPALSDAEGWLFSPQYFMTIHCADVNGDGRSEMLARDSRSMHTFLFNALTYEWSPSSKPLFPQWQGEQVKAYVYISKSLMDNPPDPDIRSSYTSTTATISTYISDLNSLARPSDIDPDDWNFVKAQILNELSLVQAVDGWFSKTSSLINSIFSMDSNSVEPVRTVITTSEESAFSTTIMSVLSGVAWAVLGANPDFAMAAMVAGLLSEAFTAAGAASGGDLSLTVAELQSALNTSFVNAVAANGETQSAVVQDWSLLQAMGTPIIQNVWRWDDKLTGALLGAGQQSYTLWLWQLLMPLRWQVIRKSVADCDETGSGCPPVGFVPLQYSLNDGSYIYWTQGSGFADFPGQPCLSGLFDITGLNVPLTVFFYRLNGWNMKLVEE